MKMNIEVKYLNEDDICEIDISGNVDVTNIQDVYQTLVDVHKKPQHIMLNISDVQKYDLSFLQMLISFQKTWDKKWHQKMQRKEYKFSLVSKTEIGLCSMIEQSIEHDLIKYQR